MGSNLNRLGHLEPLLNAGSGENRLQALGAVSEQTMASISTSGRGLFLAEAALSSLDLIAYEFSRSQRQTYFGKRYPLQRIREAAETFVLATRSTFEVI
jgi:hypothetical protein